MNRFWLRYNRVHAVGVVLRERAASCRTAALGLQDQDSPFAASLRGKAKGFEEAAQLVDRLEKNRPIRGRFRDRRASG